ncbi:hypothetical protein NEUTE2DRAFT_130651 [Neurospora tetrasperma FGSC 2509]|nr:hypothetical protein NEUTE2DRAFT_130651 [Neurospora tetrasperma FGSC 2509]
MSLGCVADVWVLFKQSVNCSSSSFCRSQQQNSTKKPIGSDDCVVELDARGGLDTVVMLCPRTRGRGSPYDTAAYLYQFRSFGPTPTMPRPCVTLTVMADGQILCIIIKC